MSAIKIASVKKRHTKYDQISVSDIDIEDFWSKHTKLSNGCLVWVRGSIYYGTIWIKGISYKTHIIAFFISRGFWPNYSVLHRCDNPSCDNPDHIYDGDLSQNMKDRTERGKTHSSDKKNYLTNVKLSREQILDIRARFIPGFRGNNKALSIEFNVSQATISMVAYRQRWGHVE